MGKRLSVAGEIDPMRQFAVLFTILMLLTFACSKAEESGPASNSVANEAVNEHKELRMAMRAVEPFFKPMGEPAAYDWLGSHNEPGETFDEYLVSDPTRPTNERQKIYVLPLGTFTPQQKKVIEVTAGYLEAFYDLPVEQMPEQKIKRPLEPGNFRKDNSFTHFTQIRTGYLLQEVLKPMLPDDAAALIAFTNDDLYPDPSMNYVFGQASLEDRVGVWSLFRLDDNTNYDTFLRRTLKIAAHETGHMFSMRHCKKYECVMSGSNHIGETDRWPIDVCPECMAKICWVSDVSPKARYERLAEFCKKNGLVKEAQEFERKAKAVS